MTDPHIPTEQELDALLPQEPQFDLDAVKRRALSQATGGTKQPRKTQAPLRGLLIAAVICALSISAVAAVDFATDGRLSQALGIRKELPEAVSAAETPPAEKPAPLQEPSAPEQPVQEMPELDGQLADALQVSPGQAQSLRPAVQAVEQAVEDQDIRMTVLQTLGDSNCLYVKLRFDFPEAVPASEDLQFEKIRLSIEDLDGFASEETILERSAQSITYLFQIRQFQLSDAHLTNGLTATVSFENYGAPHRYTADEVVELTGEAGSPYTTILFPNGTMDWEVSEEDLAALPPETSPPFVYDEGFTISVRTDGSKVVTYDGQHGDQRLTACLAPAFDAVVTGKWEQSWTLSYQDLSRSWQGAADLLPAGGGLCQGQI